MVRSAASDVHFASDTPNSLDQQEGISDQFADAQQIDPRDDLLADYAEQTGQDERESEMVKEDAMSHDLNPPPEIAAEQDRETFDAKWEAEQENARDDLMADYADQVSNDLELEQDWELGV